MILVTGANGFIGRALCARLAAEGREVRGAVRNARQAVELPETVVPAVIGEVGPDTDWSAALDGVETVVHLAARVHQAGAGAGAARAYDLVNRAGTERLALQALERRARRLVFLSSVKVHGEENTLPYREDMPCRPRDPYGESKLAAEEALGRIGRQRGLEVVILRPPLVYGAGAKANFAKLMTAIRRGIPLPLGSIENRRSLIYLENLTDAISVCMTHRGAAGMTFLVSDGEDVSTPELVRRLAAALGRPARLVPCPPGLLRVAGRLTGRSAAVDRLVGSLTVDSSRIRRELGWKPPFTLAGGLAATAAWFEERAAVPGKGDLA